MHDCDKGPWNWVTDYKDLVVRVGSLQWRNSAFKPREAGRHPVYDGASVEGLSPEGDCRCLARRARFESMLSESFGGGYEP